MKVLTIGGGAREHAAVEALYRAGSSIYAVMSNNNPGIAARAVKSLLVKETDIDRICEFAIENGVELVFVGPEAPLAAGVVDALMGLGIPCASPTQAAARIETSKTFMRELVQNHKIPGNLGYAPFDNADDAIEYIKSAPYQVAIKPVGLTGGKGVKVQGEQLQTLDDAVAYINEIFQHGVGGGKVIIEEKAEGEEFTQMVFCNGTNVYPMPLVQDHKRAYEGDTGPNTGGMGSYSDANHLLPFVTQADREKAVGIVEDIVTALRDEGCSYHGVMYGQFMLTKDGPKIIEINARFGDPEAMKVLSVLGTNFEEILKWMAGIGNLKGVEFLPKATVCKYVVPEGYGTAPKAGHTISIDTGAINSVGGLAYFGSVDVVNESLHTGTSRSIGIVGCGDTIAEAEKVCEAALAYVKCDAIYVRHDIGTAELIQKRIDHMKQIRG